MVLSERFISFSASSDGCKKKQQLSIRGCPYSSPVATSLQSKFWEEAHTWEGMVQLATTCHLLVM